MQFADWITIRDLERVIDNVVGMNDGVVSIVQ